MNSASGSAADAPAPASDIEAITARAERHLVECLALRPLAVPDELARLTRKYLEQSPYRMLEAGSGPAGVLAAREERPDVILLDFLLDDMTAFDVLDELEADPRTRGIPVVIVTSHLLDTDERRRLAAKTEAILSKDSLSRELAINRIRDALPKSGVPERRLES